MSAVNSNTSSLKIVISPKGAFVKPAPLVIHDLESPKHAEIQELNDHIGKWTRHSEKHEGRKKHTYYHPL